MIKKLLFILPLFLLAANAISAELYPHTIEIFTDSSEPMSNMGYLKRMKNTPAVKEYDLEAMDKFRKELAKDLPKTEDKARLVVNKRIADMGNGGFEKAAQERLTPILLAIKYRLTHYPAVVFNNGESVIYGLNDMGQVIRKYLQIKKMESK